MKKALSWMLVLCMLFALVGCGGGKEEPTKTDDPATTDAPATTDGDAKVLKIGMSMPLTGASATAGIAAMQGFTTAATEINNAGGLDIGGEKYIIEVICEDDQGVPAEAVSVAQKLLTKDKVDIMMSSVLSSCGLAIMELAPDYPEVLFSTVSCASDNFAALVEENHDRYYNFFKPNFNNADYSQASIESLAYYIDKGDIAYDNKTIAFICEDNDFGRGWAAGAKDWVNELLPGSTLVAEEYIEVGTTDFYATLNKFKSLDPDVVVCLTLNMSSGVAYCKQTQEIGAEWFSAGVNFPIQEGFLEQAGSAAEGLMFVPFSADFENDQGKIELKERVLKVYPDAGVTQTHVEGYDTMMLVATALEDCGKIRADEGLADAYQNAHYEGYLGTFEFRENHTAKFGADYIPCPAAQVQDGKFYTVYPVGSDTFELIGNK